MVWFFEEPNSSDLEKIQQKFEDPFAYRIHPAREIEIKIQIPNRDDVLRNVQAYVRGEIFHVQVKKEKTQLNSFIFFFLFINLFLVFSRYKTTIELDIIDTDMRNEQNKNVDVNGIVHFEN